MWKNSVLIYSIYIGGVYAGLFGGYFLPVTVIYGMLKKELTFVPLKSKTISS